MSFKLLRGEESEFLLPINNHLTILQPQFTTNNIEFCYQFDDDNPVTFASGENDLHIHISPTPNGNIIFNNNGRTFKIFSRERL